MEGVSRAFGQVSGRRGAVLGILPSVHGAPDRTPPGYPNPWVEIPVRTHLSDRGSAGEGPGSRNHLVILSADAVVALPGGEGTASELKLAVRYGRPVILFGRDDATSRGGKGEEQRVHHVRDARELSTALDGILGSPPPP